MPQAVSKLGVDIEHKSCYIAIMSFMDYIRSLMAVTEVPIEPSVSKLSKEKQRELRCGAKLRCF